MLTLETCCGYGYDLRREYTLVSRIFKGRPVQHQTLLQTQRSTGPRYLSPIQSGSGKPAPYKLKKRQLFPGLRPVSPGSIASQLWPPKGSELRLQVREYWPDSLFVHYLDSGYFQTYIYLNTTYVCNSSAWFKLTIKLENGGHFDFPHLYIVKTSKLFFK